MSDSPEVKGELDVIKSVARSRNRHIIRVDDFWTEKNEEEGTFRTYLKMERCDGTLAQFLRGVREKRQGDIRPLQLLDIMEQVLSGLRHCHDRNVCHRDLKLSNSILSLFLFLTLVLYLKSGLCRCRHCDPYFYPGPLQDRVSRWVLTDFGFSTILESKSVVQSRFGRGTEAYRAPELIEHAMEVLSPSTCGIVSKHGDIWAVGCILFKLATTGQGSAFAHDHAALAYKQKHRGYHVPQLNATHNRFSGLTRSDAGAFRKELNSILRACFARDPKERPTAGALWDTIITLVVRFRGN
jgi:serine/threonine protein kinase